MEKNKLKWKKSSSGQKPDLKLATYLISRPKWIPDPESLDWRGTKWFTLWIWVSFSSSYFRPGFMGLCIKWQSSQEWGQRVGSTLWLGPNQGFPINAVGRFTWQLNWARGKTSLPKGQLSWLPGASWLHGALPSWRGAGIVLMEETWILSRTQLCSCPRICQHHLWLQKMAYYKQHCFWSR